MAARADIRPQNPIPVHTATSTGTGSWVNIGRALPTRFGVELAGGKTGTVQLEGTIGRGVVVNVGAASTTPTGGRIVTLSTGLPAISTIRAKVTAIGAQAGTLTVKLAL